MTKDEALKLALEWLDTDDSQKIKMAKHFIEQALAQEPAPENRCVRELREFAKTNQETYIFPLWNGRRVLKYLNKAIPVQKNSEPVAWVYDPITGSTTLPQRTWVGLSVFEINDLVESTEYEDYQDLVERTEAKLMEKNT